jgi:hypothetical protein
MFASSGKKSTRTICKEAIREAFIKGIQPQDSLLIHGTNIHSIQSALKHDGRLLTGRSPGNEKRIYFFPNTTHPEAAQLIPANFRFESKLGGSVSVDQAIEAVSWYATRGAQEAMLQELYEKRYGQALPFDLVSNLIDSLSNFNRFDNVDTRGIRTTSFLKGLNPWIPEIRSRAGLVLSFSSDLLKEFELKRAEGNDDGLFIQAPLGVPLRYITGIEPLGDIEYQIIEDLAR